MTRVGSGQRLMRWRAMPLTAAPALTQTATISAGIFIADQLTKHALTHTFRPGDSLPLLPSLLQLTYVQNTGAAFGLFKGQQALFVVLSLAVIGWIGWEAWTRPLRAGFVRWGCALVAGGAAGNLVDRLRFGYVVDFIDLRVWPVFNLADSAITVGVGLLLWHSLRRRHSTSDQPQHAKSQIPNSK